MVKKGQLKKSTKIREIIFYCVRKWYKELYSNYNSHINQNSIKIQIKIKGIWNFLNEILFFHFITPATFYTLYAFINTQST